MRASSQRGLSLLEMLVVLVISGLALLLTTQAIGQYQRAQSSVLFNERSGREFRLSETWWREAVRDIQAPDEGSLEGDADGFEAITLSSLSGPTGTPVAQAWRAVFADDGGWAMGVTESEQERVLVFRRSSALRFAYLDAEGKLHDEWPPALGKPNPLPEAIVATWESPAPGRVGQVLVAHIAGAKRSANRPFESEVEL